MNKIHKTLAIAAAAMIAGITTYEANGSNMLTNMQLSEVEAIAAGGMEVTIITYNYPYNPEKEYDRNTYNIPCNTRSNTDCTFIESGMTITVTNAEYGH